jgi:hypothetical protein
MKQFILFILIASCILSCTSSSDKTSSADTSASADKALPVAKPSGENLALVNKYLAAVESLDTAAMSALMADNYKGYGPSIGDSAGKREILENWKYNFDHFYASIKYTRYQNSASTLAENNNAEPGDWVSNWAYCTIKYKDGKGPIYLWVNSVYRIENGKIMQSRVFYNEADWLRQLGYTFMKPIQKKQGESL